MELITRDVKQNIEKAQEIQQVTFDDDYVIRIINRMYKKSYVRQEW